MTPKKPGGLGRRHLIWMTWKLVILLSAGLCLLAIVKLHSGYNRHYISTYGYDLSSTSLSSSSRVGMGGPPPSRRFVGPPRVAFLFLARRDLPLDFLWANFFENADVANFSIYIHSAPGFEFDESTTRSHFFYGRQIRNSIQVGWGESSMIQAERLLLAAALEDPSNQRFVLLSDSCVPLYSFSYIYKYLITSPRSFVDSFLDTKEGRYNKKMAPVISKGKWRKGSQWVSLNRRHAQVVVNDHTVFPVFQKHCKRRPPVDVSKGKLNIKLQKQHNCIPDEHYVPTLLSMYELEGQLERRTLTYTEWNQSAMKMENQAWHPTTFTYTDAGPRKINEIKEINHIYYETERRTEWCQSNSVPVPCFLFARKFSRGAAMRLLAEGVLGPFDPMGILATPP